MTEYAVFRFHVFPVTHAIMTHWYVGLATVFMAAQPLITSMTQDANSQYAFSVMSATLCSEILKLWFSLGIYVRMPPSEKSHDSLVFRDVLHFAVPAIFYMLNNNLVFLIISNITSTQFQILSSSKTVFTALLMRFVLGRVLTVQKWSSVASLTSGAAFVVVANRCEFEESSGEQTIYRNYFVAVSATLASCLLSSFAGVYNELLLKKDGHLHSIHLQNSLLYSWGVVFNAISTIVIDREKVFQYGPFVGYNRWVAALILNNALTGLCISAVLKMCNNLVRVFAHTAAIIVTALIDTIFLDAALTVELLLAIVVVASSSVVYANDGPLQEKRTSRQFLARERSGVSDVELDSR